MSSSAPSVSRASSRYSKSNLMTSYTMRPITPSSSSRKDTFPQTPPQWIGRQWRGIALAPVHRVPRAGDSTVRPRQLRSPYLTEPRRLAASSGPPDTPGRPGTTRAPMSQRLWCSPENPGQWRSTNRRTTPQSSMTRILPLNSLKPRASDQSPIATDSTSPAEVIPSTTAASKSAFEEIWKKSAASHSINGHVAKNPANERNRAVAAVISR